MYISLFSPPILGSQSFNALNIFGLFASLSINKFMFEGSTPRALIAYSLKAFASLLAKAASKFVRYSYFSMPIIIAILFLSLLVFTLFGSNFSYPFATFVSFISTFIVTFFSVLLFHLSVATKVNSSPALVSIINPSNKNSPSSLI